MRTAMSGANNDDKNEKSNSNRLYGGPRSRCLARHFDASDVGAATAEVCPARRHAPFSGILCIDPRSSTSSVPCCSHALRTRKYRVGSCQVFGFCTTRVASEGGGDI